VVEFKNCNNYFDCTTCKYDAGMRMKAQKGNQIHWRDAMRKRSDLNRICRHTMTRRIGKRACHQNYECSKCDFDQFFEDVWCTKVNSLPGRIQKIKGFDLPADYGFHTGHAWAKIEDGGTVRIGFDDFVLKVLGKADALELPLMGKELNRNSAGWGLKRKGHTADVLSPVGGVIMEVNPKVRENPQLANQDPFGDGWLFVVRTPDTKRTMKNLMTGPASMSWLNSEIARLESMIEEVAGPLAADGGVLAEDVYGNIPDLGWDNLTKTFLKTG
jgi:glycine cleavage system H lipoate-binding protein